MSFNLISGGTKPNLPVWAPNHSRRLFNKSGLCFVVSLRTLLILRIFLA